MQRTEQGVSDTGITESCRMVQGSIPLRKVILCEQHTEIRWKYKCRRFLTVKTGLIIAMVQSCNDKTEMVVFSDGKQSGIAEIQKIFVFDIGRCLR